MKVKPSILVSVSISIVSLFLLLGFRTVPVSRLWKNYQVLYVYTTELTQNDIMETLYKNGCHDVISITNQQLPVLSSESPIQVQPEDSYIFKRNLFFTDRTNTARVFYIPDSQSRNLERSVMELSGFQGTTAGTDGRTAFPWIAPIITLLFVLVLIGFSNHRDMLVSGIIFPVILSFARPMYTVAGAAMFLCFSIFLLQKLWKRKNFIKTFTNSPYTTVFSISPVLLLIFSSPASSFFYILTIAASVSSLILFSEWEENKYKACDFKPVFIISSKMIPVVGHLGIRLMGCLTGAVVLLFVTLTVFGKISNVGTNASTPSLPAPVNSSSSELVNLKDLTEWGWYTTTFPYRKLYSQQYEKPMEGSRITIPDYREENGKIVSYENTVYTYNSRFRDSILNKVEKLNYPALEKMMLKQGKNTSYGYSKGTMSSSERFGQILLLVFIVISGGLAGYYIVGRKRYGLSI